VVAIGRGVGGCCELLTGPLDVGDGARDSNPCGAIGTMRNLGHIVPSKASSYLHGVGWTPLVFLVHL
jgi:hypothetical protein